MNIFPTRSKTIDEPAPDSGPLDDLFEWADSPEGILLERTQLLVEEELDQIEVDEHGQRLVWADEAALDIEQSAQRILEGVELGEGFTLDGIQEEIVDWLEQGYLPEGLDEAQSEQMERRIERWIRAYRKRQQERSGG